MIPYFLKQKPDSNSLQFKLEDKELVFFIPTVFFDRKYVKTINGRVNLLGIFNYTIRDINTHKMDGLYTFNYPTLIECEPSNVVKIKDLDNIKGLRPDDYTLLIFRNNDIVISSTKVIEDVANADLFYSIFTSGRLPSSIPYNEIQNYFTENLLLNGKSYDLNMQLFGLIIGEMATQTGKPDILFRHTNMEDFHDYSLKNIKTSPKTVSAFSSYTSEVYDEAIINANLVNKRGSSPMEKLFMGY